jgi:hypothetical protein
MEIPHYLLAIIPTIANELGQYSRRNKFLLPPAVQLAAIKAGYMNIHVETYFSVPLLFSQSTANSSFPAHPLKIYLMGPDGRLRGGGNGGGGGVTPSVKVKDGEDFSLHNR